MTKKLNFKNKFIKYIFLQTIILKQLQKGDLFMLDRIALILVTIGALNWGSVGLFKFDLVAWLFGGQAAILSRIVYVLVALAGIWCISLLFRENEMVESRNDIIDDKVE